MARSRVIYQSLALFAGPSPSTGDQSGIKQLYRLQTVNYGLDRPQENVNQMGNLASIDRLSLEDPVVNLDFSYLAVDLVNEAAMGFEINSGTSALSNILNKTEDDRNYFLMIAPEGEDAHSEDNVNPVIGFGNGFLSSYTAEGSVGGFPTVTVAIEALNIRGYTDGVDENNPAIDVSTGSDVVGQNFTLPASLSDNAGAGQPTAIRKGDITLDFENATGLFEKVTDVCVQSYNISFDLSREAIQCLGTRFSKSREPQFPVDVTATVEFLASDVQTGNFRLFNCEDPANELAISLNSPQCTGVGDVSAEYRLKNAKLQSQNWSNSIGPAGTVTATWVGQISAAGDTTNGLFMSGVVSYA